MKANFKLSKSSNDEELSNKLHEKTDQDLTKEEFEDYVIKSGAAGSFMVFRSDKSDDELGLEEL